MKRFVRISAALALLVGGAGQAKAGVVYLQSFDGTTNPTFTTDPYWGNSANDNGVVVSNLNTVFGGVFANGINQDVSGSGNFLFDGTLGAPSGSIAYESNTTIPVAANTDYVLSFYLTNANDTNPAEIQALIDGQVLGSPVSAAGTWSSDGWQQFSFTWHSGSSTSATVMLNDLTTTGNGDDFGIDNISLATAAPEPATLTLLGIGTVGLLGFGRLRRKCAVA